MGWQQEPGSAAGASPDRAPQAPGRDPRLAQFAGEGPQDGPAPSGRLALLADELSGPGRRCPGATDNELTGLLRAWAALESWAAAGKLGVIREMIRRESIPPPGGDDLPEAWSPSLRYELAAALACSTQSAETLAWLAREQQARLPGIGALLEDGTLTPAKARAVVETFRCLDDADAARAEALIAGQLTGKTYTQVLRLAEQAALTVDPELAERRREHAQKKDARVSFFREQAGTAGLSGRDLPPDEALAAMASVNARAEEYKESGAFGDTPMDVLRAYAYLDLLNGVTARARIAAADPQDEAAEAAEALAWAETRAAVMSRTATGPEPGAEAGAEPQAGAPAAASARGSAGSAPADPPDCRCDRQCGECDGECLPDGGNSNDDNDNDNDNGDNGGDDDAQPDDSGSGPGSGGPGSSGPGARSGAPAAGRAPQPRPADLIVPLATLLGLARRPGEIQGFGLLDPALARELAAPAAASPATPVCVTVTSPEGYATGHGCARPARGAPLPADPAASPAVLPARLNLTIPAAALPCLSSLPGSQSHAGSWTFSPRAPRPSRGSPDPPDGYGTWTLTVPGGRELTVRLDPVPTFECDHRHESHGYQPSDRLRHLVQIRDGTCTFPTCNRHARESDFEHGAP